jgi:sulfur relay (sulfurtransferase) complex TusBCD TusD component (DsrE family)
MCAESLAWKHRIIIGLTLLLFIYNFPLLKITFIINDAPYGSEKACNALIDGIEISSMAQLARWTVESDKVLAC